MKYKEFVDWCNERACDGQWSMVDALVCMDIIKQVNSIKYRWWRRRKQESEREGLWNTLNAKLRLEEKLMH